MRRPPESRVAELLRLVALFAAVGLALVATRLVSLDRLVRIAGRLPRLPGLVAARRREALLDRALRAWRRRGGCLERALVLVWLLPREGTPPVLRIGVAKQARGLRAHAWVEQGDRALDGEPAAREGLTLLASLSPS
jgi:hypothetical protein